MKELMIKFPKDTASINSNWLSLYFVLTMVVIASVIYRTYKSIWVIMFPVNTFKFKPSQRLLKEQEIYKKPFQGNLCKTWSESHILSCNKNQDENKDKCAVLSNDLERREK